MTNDQRLQIRKVQSILLSIDSGTPKFFNISKFKELGLIVINKKWGVDSSGNKAEVGHSFQLTPKAKMYLNVVV